jgi:hypothetical protein
VLRRNFQVAAHMVIHEFVQVLGLVSSEIHANTGGDERRAASEIYLWNYFINIRNSSERVSGSPEGFR